MQIWNGPDQYCWRYRADTILSTGGQTDSRTRWNQYTSLKRRYNEVLFASYYYRSGKSPYTCCFSGSLTRPKSVVCELNGRNDMPFTRPGLTLYSVNVHNMIWSEAMSRHLHSYTCTLIRNKVEPHCIEYCDWNIIWYLWVYNIKLSKQIEMAHAISV